MTKRQKPVCTCTPVDNEYMTFREGDLDCHVHYPTNAAMREVQRAFVALRDVVAEELIYPWAVPLAYRVAAFLDRFKGGPRG